MKIKDRKVSKYLVWQHEDHIHLFDEDTIAGKLQLAMELRTAIKNQESQFTVLTLRIT